MRKFAAALIVIFALFGVYGAFGIVSQAREDYSNFRKIVQWVAIKQQQEELARQRQAAQQAKPAVPPAPETAPPAGK